MGHKTLKQLREELLANRGGRAASSGRRRSSRSCEPSSPPGPAPGSARPSSRRARKPQPFVDRLKGSRTLPSMRTLLKVAEAAQKVLTHFLTW